MTGSEACIFFLIHLIVVGWRIRTTIFVFYGPFWLIFLLCSFVSEENILLSVKDLNGNSKDFEVPLFSEN